MATDTLAPDADDGRPRAARGRRPRPDRAARRPVRRDPRAGAHQPRGVRRDPRGRRDAVRTTTSATGSGTSSSRWPRPARPAWASPRSTAAAATSARRSRRSRPSRFGDLSVLVKVGVQFGLFGGAILQLGTEQHHEAYLADLVTGKLMGCFAMTETGHGSNVQALGTVATYDAATEEFVITTPDDASRKDYIGNAARHADVAVVFAQLEVGGAVRGRARVRGADPRGRRAGARRTHRGRRSQDRPQRRRQRPDLVRRRAGAAHRAAQPVRRRHRRRGRTSRRSRTPTGASSRCSAPSCRAGSASAAPASTPPRSRSPSRPGTPAAAASSRPPRRTRRSCSSTTACTSAGCSRCSPAPTRCTSRRRSSPASCTTCSRREAPTTSTSAASSSRAPPAPRRSAPGTRPAPSRSAARRCGGAGYLSENRFAALKADTDVFTTFEGDNHVLLQLVAKGLLTDYASDFEDMDQFGMVRFVAGLAVETVIEKTNVHKLLERIRDLLPGGDEWDQEAGLLDPNYQLAMLRFREEHMLAGVARRLKRGIDNEHEPRRGVLPGAGPRDRRGPRARRAAGARGVRRQGPRHWRTATTRSR